MKRKLLLFVIISIIVNNNLSAANLKILGFPANHNGEKVLLKSAKKNVWKYGQLPALAVVNPPTVVAGSTCGPGIVTLSATGTGGEIIEWFSSQTSSTVLATGNTFSTNVSTTTTFYVSARSGADVSTRVPVVASVYFTPPPVTLSSNPANNSSNPLCLGTSVTFTATGGADLFEFSVDGVVKQAMSSSRTYTTNTLTNGQVVTVKSRYAVTLDGNLTENAWGTGALEDNLPLTSLSPSAVNGYINSLKISPTEDGMVFGVAGKVLNYRRIMIFLDTKPGGFNVSNYGDENGSAPHVRAYNYFNNNPSTFDSYFLADYCVTIATDDTETNYYADVMELKSGLSTKTYLGTNASPTPALGVNKSNSGTSDYDHGFELIVSKALIGYSGGDLKFFAFTIKDQAEDNVNYSVTNSFLSPATRTSDYGSGAINYNNEAPNPVVVAGAALTPCYSTDSMTMNFAANPTVASVGQNQSSCSLVSTGLGGNTPTVGTGVWSKKSGPGTVSFSDSTLGNATATVSTPGTYVFTWTISNGQCPVSSADITVVYNVTDPPTGLASQNFCKISSPKVSNLAATGNNIEWFANPAGGTALDPNTDLATGIYYAEQTDATTLCKSISRLPVNVVVDNPVGPIVDATQTFCNTAKVSDLVATGTAVKWYAAPTGGSPLDPNTVLVNGEIYYATQTVTGTLSCESTPRSPSQVIIDTTPVPTGTGSQTICNAGTVADLSATASVGTIQWYADATGGSPLPSSHVLISGTTYYASQTIGTCESANRYANTVTINNPQIPVSGGNQSVCATDPIQTLTATVSVSSGTIVWYDALTGGNVVTGPILNTVGSVTYYAENVIGSCSSVSRTPVTLEIKDSPFLTVDNKTCSADLLTYTVDFTVASGSVITKSTADGTIVGNSITNIPAGTNFSITADLGNGCLEVFNVIAPNCSCSIISNPVSNGNKSVCEGLANPTLSATVNAGETIDWYSTSSNGNALVSDSSTYTPTVSLPGVYTYYAEARNSVSNCVSSSRTPVSLTINSQSKPTGLEPQPFCEAQNATVANLVAVGTGVKWYADAIGGTTLSSTDPLVHNEDYFASQTATTGLLCESFERLKVTVIINAPAAPTTTVPNPVFCNSATVADLTVTGTNVKWYDSLGNLLTPSSLLNDGEVYSATQTVAGCESVGKLNVTVTIEKPSAIIMNGPNPQIFCESENATVASLTARVASGVNIKWYSSASGDTPLPDTTPLINAIYYGSQTTALGCESTPRLAVTVTINAPVSPTGPGIQLFCSSQSAAIANLQVTGTGVITWYDAAVPPRNLLLGTTPLVDGKKYYATQTVASCESVNSLEVSVGIVDPLTPTITSQTPLFCESQNATLNSIVLNGIINNSNVVWYNAPIGGGVLPSSTPITLGGVYYAVQQTTAPLAGCESGRLQVSPVLDLQQPPVIDNITQPTCAVNTGSVLFSGLPATGNWSITPSTGTPVSGSGAVYEFKNLPASNNYTFKVTNANGCTSVNATAVVNINTVPTAASTPTLASAVQPTCGIPTGTIIIGFQTGMEYSLDGTTYQVSNVFNGLAPNDYTLYVRNPLDVTCVANSLAPSKINAVPDIPTVPVALSVVQPTCAVPSGSVSIAAPQTGMEYSLDGMLYQPSNVFNNLAPNDYTLYARNSVDISCVSQSVSPTTINAIPTAPTVPTTSSVVQPTCAVPSGSVSIVSQSGMEYSLDGSVYQLQNTFNGLAPNNYTLYVRNILDATCVASSLTSTVIDAIPTAPTVPTTLSVVQPTCAVPSGSISIVSQSGMEYSLDGSVYQSQNTFNGLVPNNYTLYVRNILDATCVASSLTSTTIDAIPTAPTVPATSSVVQPTCALPSGSISIVSQSGMEYSLDGSVYQSQNTFAGLAPNNYTLYVRNILDATCAASSLTSTTINTQAVAPAVPTTSSEVQPTCAVPSGSISIVSQSGMEYSLDGTVYQSQNTFNGLAPNNYTLYVRNVLDATCVSQSVSPIIINAIPTAPTVPTTLSVVQPTCAVPSGSISIVSQSGMEYSLDGSVYQSQNTFAGLAPNNYTLYVRNILDATCAASSLTSTTINTQAVAPTVPTTSSEVQPTCALPSGSISIVSQSGMEYSLDGSVYQSQNTFNGLAPNNYTLYVRNVLDATCVASSLTSTVINAIPVAPVVPTTSSVVQPTCALPSGSISIASQSGMEYSLDGTAYQSQNAFNGLVPNNYTLYVRNILDATCVSQSVSPIIINAIPTAPTVPTTLSVVQPTCAVPSGSISIVSQSGMEYSLDGSVYQLQNTFNGLAPNNYTLYVRNTVDATCSSSSLAGTTIDARPLTPPVPTTSSVVQPTCAVPFGTIEIAGIAGVEYSVGNGYQDNPVFLNLAPNNYTISVRFKSDTTCETFGADQLINVIPPDIQFESNWTCQSNEYVLTASPLSNSYDPDDVEYIWKDQKGNQIGTNSNVLNVTDVIDGTAETESFPLTYSLTVKSSSTNCETSSNVVIESIYCDIQKGISPDGNGSNDFLDLRLMDVKKLEVFNRYGIQVYNQSNYTDQWSGQTNNGEALPSATYYYVIEFNNGKSKTGWIYLIREN